MNLFIDGHHLGRKKHGVEKFLSGVLFELEAQNTSTNIFVGIEKSEYNYVMYRFKASNIKFIPYKFGGILRLIVDIPLILATNKIDIFYGQYFLPILRPKRVKYFFTVHDILYEEYPHYYSFLYIIIRRFLIKWSALKAEKVFTISEYSRNQLNIRYQIALRKIIVIPIQIERPNEQLPGQDTVISNNILYVSRFEERKNHLSLIRLFSKLPIAKKTRLVLVGFEVDGSKSRCIELVRQLNLTARVDFLENIDSTELDYLHLTAKIIIYPSFCEGLGMPVLEALLANSRVLFSNTTSMGEFMFAARHMMNPFDEDEMYDKILKLLNDPKMFEEDRDRVVSAILEKYNVITVACQYSENMGLKD